MTTDNSERVFSSYSIERPAEIVGRAVNQWWPKQPFAGLKPC